MSGDLHLVLDARYVRVGPHDGISRYSAGIAVGLARLAAQDPSLRVELMVSDEAQRAHLPELPWFRGPDPVSAGEVLTGQVLNRRCPDVVFSPMQTMGALRRRFGLILTLHDLIYYDHPAPPPELPAPVRLGWRAFHRASWPQRLALDRADAVATVSETSARLIRDRRLTSRPVHVIPNAASQDRILAAEEALRRLPERGRSMVYLGSFMPYKDVDTLARTAARLPERELHLLSRVTDRQREHLLEVAGPGAHLVFHGGVSEQEHSRLLREAGVLVHASRAEGYGLPLMEAFCAGTPVVCTDIPIFHEVCGDAAAYCPPGDDAAFARAVAELDDPQTARGRVLAGLERASSWTWGDSAARLVDLAAGVAQGRRAS
ncbi:glycosyltransferase family 1 protein [Kocuria palustris]|uniref:glycosyltransferase family 4 protein n=1 Tax=Kocuria palustris TaxID=71999 RepID=UPI001642B93A|nr:glycosyltransferase family 1 protein [Kocuria palustris]